MHACHVSSWRETVVCPLFKRPSLGPVILDIYQPVSNLPFWGKSGEQVTERQLQRISRPISVRHQTGEQCGDKVDYTCGCPGQSWDKAGVSILVLLDLSQFLIPLTTVFGYGVGRARWSDPYSVVGLSLCGQERKRMCLWTLTCGDPQGSMLSPLLST